MLWRMIAAPVPQAQRTLEIAWPPAPNKRATPGTPKPHPPIERGSELLECLCLQSAKARVEHVDPGAEVLGGLTAADLAPPLHICYQQVEVMPQLDFQLHTGAPKRAAHTVAAP